VIERKLRGFSSSTEDSKSESKAPVHLNKVCETYLQFEGMRELCLDPLSVAYRLSYFTDR
jgi:hypothetical protein